MTRPASHYTVPLAECDNADQLCSHLVGLLLDAAAEIEDADKADRHVKRALNAVEQHALIQRRSEVTDEMRRLA